MRMVGLLRIPGFFLAKKDILYIWPVVRDEQQGDSDCIVTKLAWTKVVKFLFSKCVLDFDINTKMIQ